MKSIKNELQDIILRDEPPGGTDQLKKAQSFLRTNAQASLGTQKRKPFKSEEAAALLAFAEKEGDIYSPPILISDFISEGAEQKVYRLDDTHVIKTNAGIFYENWLDYFNSLLIHNYFFPATAYSLLGFKILNDELNAIVKQEYIIRTEPTDLSLVKAFLVYNNFQNNRNNDYINSEFGLIFEDLHDENVLSSNSVLFFIDTIFYLTADFYKK